MYRSLILCIILASFAMVSNGQKASGGRPYSDLLPELKSSISVPEIKLKPLDATAFRRDTALHHEPVPYGFYTDTLIDIKAAGKEDEISGKGRIWRLLISNDNARSLQLTFSKFVIPDGASLFIYNSNKKKMAGAFTGLNMRSDSTFYIADFKGDHVIAEYFEPFRVSFHGKVIIGSVGQAFKDVLESQSGTGSFININCPIGKNAQLDKHAVGKMAFRSGQYQVTCSGALINNAKNDGTPYFLTANHCLSTDAEATSLIVYFNYEVVGCNGDTLTPTVLSGSTLLTTSQSSDYTLLRLSENPDPKDQPYFAGWDARDKPTALVTAIHYPFQNTKKISLDYDSIVSNKTVVTWDDDSRSRENTHWVIGFDDGSTSQGSSGSPLFNTNHQIIGQLHGGDDSQAYYGKISYSFEYKPTKYQTMAHYLDPDSTGIFVMNGFSPSNNIPDAFFTTDFEQVCVNAPITFADYSVFRPYSRSWTITPETYTFLNETTDTSTNPVIQFLENATYHIELNLLRSDSVLSSESLNIVSGNALNVSVQSKPSGDICDCNFGSLKLKASGASDFSWSVVPADSNKIEFSRSVGDTTTIFRNNDFKAESSYTISYNLVANQATCADTMTVTYHILKPENDDIENASLIEYGRSDYFTNICASVQQNEPVPPFTSCTSQNSWCDEYGTGENIVENSVWFKFVASSTGRVSISSTGFDNQIALYKASSVEDILAGNYTIVAANDDRSDSDYRPLIISASVIPSNTYWIQVDGSGGGLEDQFYIILTELSATPTTNPIAGDLIVYPVPADDHVFIRNENWTEHNVRVNVYSTSGICVMSENAEISNQQFSLNMKNWEPGIYFVTVNTAHQEYTARIVKK